MKNTSGIVNESEMTIKRQWFNAVKKVNLFNLMMHRSCQSGLTNRKIFLERTFCTSKDFHRVEVENGLFDQNEENENGKISKDSTNWLRYEYLT